MLVQVHIDITPPHTPASVSANRRTNDTIFVASILLLLDRSRITLPSFAAVGTLSDIAACFFAAVGLLMDVAACLYSPAVEMLPLFATSVWSPAVLMSPPLQAAGSSLPPPFQASLITITARIFRVRRSQSTQYFFKPKLFFSPGEGVM
ncbi:hypothetical protein TNCV_2320171 [Trichonephila clavipes]|nr:hypothetical protein TNCV_2320171 [Trichonephila clavipes]